MIYIECENYKGATLATINFDGFPMCVGNPPKCDPAWVVFIGGGDAWVGSRDSGVGADRKDAEELIERLQKLGFTVEVTRTTYPPVLEVV